MYTNHCVYPTISNHLKEKFNIEFSEVDLFNLYGGLSLRYFKEDHDIPAYEILGNRIDADIFQRMAGIATKEIYFDDRNKARELINRYVGQNERIIVVANCYYLPFDKINYQRNSGDHLVEIVGSAPLGNDSLIVSDSMITSSINIDDLLTAMGNVIDRDYNFMFFELVDSLDNIRLREITKEIIISNCESLIFDELDNFSGVKSEIEFIRRMKEPYKKITFYSLARCFKHPNGPAFTRFILSRYEFTNTKINKVLERLSNKWNELSNNLIRVSTGKVNINLENDIENILKKEKEMCLMILNSME